MFRTIWFVANLVFHTEAELPTNLNDNYETLFSPTVANLPTNLNVVQASSSSFRVSWTPPVTVTGYQVYWTGVYGYDSGNMSIEARDTVTITGRTPGRTYDVTIVALSDHLPSPAVGSVMVTLGKSHKCWLLFIYLFIYL